MERFKIFWAACNEHGHKSQGYAFRVAAHDVGMQHLSSEWLASTYLGDGWRGIFKFASTQAGFKGRAEASAACYSLKPESSAKRKGWNFQHYQSYWEGVYWTEQHLVKGNYVPFAHKRSLNGDLNNGKMRSALPWNLFICSQLETMGTACSTEATSWVSSGPL